MSDLHSLGITATDATAIEAVDPRFLRDRLLNAQQKSWAVFHQIRNALKVGMTEIEGQQLAIDLFAKAGSQKQWHRPQIRFGSGTTLTYYDSLRPDYKLQDGDCVYFDLGPVWQDAESGLEYEGDVGDTFVVGRNADAEKLIESTHQLFQEGSLYWQQNHPTGVELYAYLHQRAKEMGYTLIEKIDGHRLSDYPHIKYTKQRLSEFRFVPSNTLWILEFQMLHPTLPLGAFYEDILTL